MDDLDELQRKARAMDWLEEHRFTAYTATATDVDDNARLGYTVLVNEEVSPRTGIPGQTLLEAVEKAIEIEAAAR